ncbi:hypothetical protein [Rathayibacter tritici]|uniref:hypothetical protein n=1 Tax=Rathayibacter tritici TaxID=33888 RepID=UPI000AFBF12B|nr:hypothetical protein [Rathayibacter tritici]
MEITDSSTSRVSGELIGPDYCEQHEPVRRNLGLSVVLFVIGYVGMGVAMFVLARTPWQTPLAVLLGLFAVVALGWGMRGQARFGARIADDLRREGYAIDRPVPMRNTNLFGKWSRRNKISPDMIFAVGAKAGSRVDERGQEIPRGRRV